jgi:sterol 3beta-glucosyltransferase
MTTPEATGGGRRRVLIATTGGGGDVVPYLGLGRRLRAAGYDVAVATHAPYEAMVTEAGLGFRPLPGDPRAWLHGEASGDGGGDGDGGGNGNGAGAPAKGGVFGSIREASDETGPALTAAVDAGADALVLGALVAHMGYHVAEARRIPCMGAYLQPTEPTREFPSVFVPANLGAWGNRASVKVIGTLLDKAFAASGASLRSDLGLPPLSMRALRRRQAQSAWPVHCGFSPTVVPRPADWRPGVEVVGYWWPPEAGDWEPTAELADFLAAGPPPVFVGFGSLGTDGERLGTLVPEALRAAGVRGVIQAGWGGLVAGGDDMLSIGEAPHEWLFPRMAAVVHAAGAGVVGAGLRAGVPAVPVPVGIDQPFWGKRLTLLGVAPDSIPFPKLTAERLGDAVRAAVTDPRFRERAGTVGEHVRKEDGAGATLDAVRRLVGDATGPSGPTGGDA